jgi:hypothetical protein
MGAMSAPLPDRRNNVVARDLDGNRVELSTSLAPRLYTCPSCRSEIGIGSEHVLVRFIPEAGEPWHQHWHVDCVRSQLSRELRDAVTTPTERKPGRGARRAQALERRRSR